MGSEVLGWRSCNVLRLHQHRDPHCHVLVLHARCHRPGNAEISLVEEILNDDADAAVWSSFHSRHTAFCVELVQLLDGLRLDDCRARCHVLLPIQRFELEFYEN